MGLTGLNLLVEYIIIELHRFLVKSTTIAVPTATADDAKRSELKSSWLKANDVKNPFQYTVEEVLTPLELIDCNLSSDRAGV